jgi:ATP-dependent Lon protease
MARRTTTRREDRIVEKAAPAAPAAVIASPPRSAEPAPLSAKPAERVTETILLVPVRNMVLFPGVVLPVVVVRPSSVATVAAAAQQQLPIGLVLQRDEKVDAPARADLHDVGTVAEILRYLTAPDGKHHVICQGLQRFRLLEILDVLDEGAKPAPGTERPMRARIERIEEPAAAGAESEARFMAVKAQAQEVLAMSPGAPEDLATALAGITSPSMLADMVATFLDVTSAEKQELLETIDIGARLEKVGAKLSHLRQVLELSQKIRTETRGTLDKAQREYFLREQLRQIQKELSGESEGAELDELKKSLEAAGMPAEAKREADRELARLERMNEASAEYSTTRTYLEVMSELPWSKSTPDSLDLARARKVLDEDHYGLERVKKLILEYLAVRKLKPDGRRANLCLVGPPGVGKTSLGQSIARAMGRAFVRVSLGGMHDEAEIRGHRRTYVGALPGTIITSLRKAGSKNPVFMLDEMDKLAKSFQGDPSSALLEVLDPEQNHSFRDNYLNVPFDLSQVLFIGTANVLEDIPGPLRDRFEVIQLPGYTREEKLAIARRFLWPRQLEQSGLSPKRIKIDERALEEIVRAYTREAGVRSLERALAAVARNVAARVAEGKLERTTIRVPELLPILGQPRFEDEVENRTSVPGVATGLAWTPYGGGILFVEATSMPGHGRLILTGQLGDVMRESAQAAMSLVKSRARHLGLDPRFFDSHDLHVHLPAGAIPKDGPSAGVALYTALVSLLTGRTVRSDVAMTGEISLRGLVLPVGGIKEKVLGARAAGIKHVLLPERNRPDVEDVPESTRKEMRFTFLNVVDDATTAAIAPDDVLAAAVKSRNAGKRAPKAALRLPPTQPRRQRAEKKRGAQPTTARRAGDPLRNGRETGRGQK